jgi:exonuclease III
MNSNHKNINVNIGSLNCRGLLKIIRKNTNYNNTFLTYIKDLKLDLIMLQETHADTPEHIYSHNMQRQAKHSCWSHYCGIVSFNSDIKITNQNISNNSRIMLVLVTHLNHAFEPFYMLNIYAPANNPPNRNRFFREVLQLTRFTATENPVVVKMSLYLYYCMYKSYT